MAKMIIEFTFSDDAFIVIEGKNVKFWEGMGLPSFEGDLEGFNTLYPFKILELLKYKVIKHIT